ncbi:phage portal protein [bacterium]|nr:phage portal protein [bacterium]
MNFQELAAQLLPPILQPKAWSSNYDNAQVSPRRGHIPGATPRDTRRDLTPHTRKELVRRARYLVRNSGFVRELVSNMAIYSVGDGIRPQSQANDPEWASRAEDYFRQWSARCEVTGRFSFEECQTLACRALDHDGEIFTLKTRDRFGLPAIQMIETHRVGGDEFADGFIDGVRLDPWGAPEAWRIVQDLGDVTELPASQLLHIFDPESVSAVRAAPTIQHSINHIVDEMELLSIEKEAVRDNSDISYILKNQTGRMEEGTDFEFRTAAEIAEGTEPGALQKITGGKVVALKPDEDLAPYQPSRPSPVFTGFIEHLRRDSAAGVLPFEFAVDPSKVGGASVRLIIAKADRMFSHRQEILIKRLIKPTWFYVIGDAIARGILPPVENWWKIACVTPRRVTADAGREAQQNREDVVLGLKTPSDHYEELGANFAEEVDRRGRDMQIILQKAEQYQIPPQMLWAPFFSLMPPPTAPVDSRQGG